MRAGKFGGQGKPGTGQPTGLGTISRFAPAAPFVFDCRLDVPHDDAFAVNLTTATSHSSGLLPTIRTERALQFAHAAGHPEARRSVLSPVCSGRKALASVNVHDGGDQADSRGSCGIRSKCRSRVISVRSCSSASAAIHRSLSGTGVPARLSCTKIRA